MKRLQTKFHADTMSHTKIIRSKQSQNLSLSQNVSLDQNYIAADFVSLLIFY